MATQIEGKVWITNLCDWLVGFPKITTNGDIMIPAKGRMKLDADEIMAQVYNRNVLFCGESGDGSHARIYIEDENIRKEVGFDDEGKTQEILNDKVIDEMFKIKTFPAFKKSVEANVITDSEKQKIIEWAKSNKVNDYQRIKYLEEYTECKF